jgi:hypothetical protein
MSNFKDVEPDYIKKIKCLWKGCEQETYVYMSPKYRVDFCRDDRPEFLMETPDGWNEKAEDCWYCPDHPRIQGKSWIYEGSCVCVEGENIGPAYGNIVKFNKNEAVIKFPKGKAVKGLNPKREYFVVSINNIRPA